MAECANAVDTESNKEARRRMVNSDLGLVVTQVRACS